MNIYHTNIHHHKSPFTMLIKKLLPLIIPSLAFKAIATTFEPEAPIPFNSAWTLNITLNDLQTAEEICPLAALDLGSEPSPLTLGYTYDGQNIDIYTGGTLAGAAANTWNTKAWITLAYHEPQTPLCLTLSRSVTPKTLTLYVGRGDGQEEIETCTWKQLGTSASIKRVEMSGRWAEEETCRSRGREKEAADNPYQIWTVEWERESYDEAKFLTYVKRESENVRVPEPGGVMYLIGAMIWVGAQRRRSQGGEKSLR